MKTTLSYKIAGTDYSSITDPAFRRANRWFPGGPIMDWKLQRPDLWLKHHAHADPAAILLQRIHLHAFAHCHGQQRRSGPDNLSSIVPYSGDIYTLNTTATYALNPKTSLQAGYIFSYANYGQNNAVAGLPLGINFTRDEVLVGVTRKLTKRLSCALHYQFSQYSEPSSGNANNFTAQGVFATLVYKWQ